MSNDDDTIDSVIETESARTVPDLLSRAATRDPFAIALIASDTGGEVTYEELVALVSDLAAALAAETPVGITRPRIGLVLSNGQTLSVALLACAWAGEATPFNPALTMAEYERYFTATGIDLLILTDRETGPAVTAAEALGVPILRLAPEMRLLGRTERVPVRDPVPDDIAMVLMTSGSTGTPKIVPLRHRNVSRSARDVAMSLSLDPQDRCLVMWQQFHIGGLVDLLLAPLSAGGSVVLTGGFDAARFFELRDRYRPTWFQGVPTTLGELVRHVERQQLAPGAGSLRLIRSVAAALTTTLQTQLEEVFGVPVVRTFGMTEAAPLITSTRLPPAPDKPGSVGRPCGPEVCILDAAGSPVEPGETGDIAIRGENVFGGYENNEAANAAAFRGDWFLTGDRGSLDDQGDLFLAGRASEQINRGGYKIMPSEVEEALLHHVAVREAAVFGVAHATLGEDVAAAVATQPGSKADSAELRRHLSGLLSANKIPSRILIREELPRNPVGKVDRMAMVLEAEVFEDSSAVLVAPRTGPQRAIADIWMRELELPAIGIRQDFMMVGGDSLSALRVIIAMEQTFQRAMPDEVVENLTTIEEVARLLEKHDIGIPERSGQVALEPGPEVGAEAYRHPEIADRDILGALNQVSGGTELSLVVSQLLAYRTPAQIQALCHDLSVREVARTGAGWWRRLRLRQNFRRKRKEVLLEIAGAGARAGLWTRQEIAPAATLYSSSKTPVWQKTLIVGFSANRQRVSMDTYRFLLPLDPVRFDFLLLRDRGKKNLFVGGLPGMGDSISGLGAWLTDFAETEGYRERIAFGSSGGGLAALYAGLAFDWDRTVSICPPRLSKHAAYDSLFRDLASRSASGQARVLVANGHNLNDIDASRQILAHLPGIEHDFHADCPVHNLLNYSRRTGQSETHYARWFDTGAASCENA